MPHDRAPETLRGVVLSIVVVAAAGLFALRHASLVSTHPILALLAILFGVPLLPTVTAAIQGQIRWHLPPLARTYLAEFVGLLLDVLTLPFIAIVIPLQAAAGLSLLIGAGMIFGLLACVVQNLFGLKLGLMQSWSDIGIMTLITLALLAACIPLNMLAELAEERSVSVYGLLRDTIERRRNSWLGRLRP